MSTDFDSEKGWSVLLPAEAIIKQKIEKIGTPLRNWDVQINYGIKTGFNEAFIINSEKRQLLLERSPEADEIIRPILRGRDIKRYAITFQGQWLINTHNGFKEQSIMRINAQDYPSVYEHLSKYAPTLEKRQDKGEHWSNLRNCAYLNDLEKEKIIWIGLTDSPNFYLDTDGYYMSNTAVFMTGPRLKFIIGFLNSKVCEWYFKTIAATSGVGTTRWFKIYVEQIFIPIIVEEGLEFIVVNNVDHIQKAKKDGSPTAEFEERIDKAFWAIFGFTNEEVATIESCSTK